MNFVLGLFKRNLDVASSSNFGSTVCFGFLLVCFLFHDSVSVHEDGKTCFSSLVWGHPTVLHRDWLQPTSNTSHMNCHADSEPALKLLWLLRNSPTFSIFTQQFLPFYERVQGKILWKCACSNSVKSLNSAYNWHDLHSVQKQKSSFTCRWCSRWCAQAQHMKKVMWHKVGYEEQKNLSELKVKDWCAGQTHTGF